jgi:hypothetical protein
MKMNVASGASMAAAAASLMLAGLAFTPAANAKPAVGQCFGVNSCKGTSACKTASNACKGMNSCKGQGFLELSKADCTKQGGKFHKA